MHRRRSVPLNVGEGFFLDGGNHDVKTLGARGIQHQQGKPSVSSDEANSLRHGQRALPEFLHFNPESTEPLLMFCMA
jgi:hypothetical protein